MSTWKKWAIGGFGVVVLGLSLWAVREIRDRADERRQDAAYAEMISAFRTEFRTGTSVSEVRSFATSNRAKSIESGNHVYLWLGEDRSHVWYCNAWTTYADLTFDRSVAISEARLMTIEKEVRGETCL